MILLQGKRGKPAISEGEIFFQTRYTEPEGETLRFIFIIAQKGGGRVEKKKRVYRKNTVPGRQRGKKYPEAVKTAALCELLGNSNLSDVAKKYGVPESTLRGWMTKAAPGGA